MKRVRVVLVACSVLVLFAAALSAAPCAPEAATAPMAPTADAVFLASLATPAPVTMAALPGVGVPTPSPMACPVGFCAAERRDCQAACAPCLGVSVCIISICDSTCGCQC
ncbi:MAG TPA: hypothetical protein VGR07_11090 [Thermoanaerobaculia bacterium]|jgi:hypothetical protein|nr:hypothetical protein [Thermoanaerobaculia bacterium]